MKTALTAVLLSAALTLASAARAAMPAGSNNNNAQPGAASTGASSDGEVAGVVAAANQGELDAAGIAMKKARSAAVKKFAAHMKKDHTAAKMKMKATGVTPVDSDRSTAMKGHAKQEGEMLGKTAADGFDRAYMDAQVDDHSTLLKALDEELIPKAKDIKLSAFLKDVRGTVSSHLDEAKRIQGEMKK